MYKVGEVEEVKILKISKTHIMVQPLPILGWMGILHISEVSDYLVKNLENLFKQNNHLFLQIISIDKNKKFISFSFKAIRPKFLKNPNKFVLEETKNKGTNLLENTMKVVNND